MSSTNIIGKSYKRPDGPDKATGKTKFITDINIENMILLDFVDFSLYRCRLFHIYHCEINILPAWLELVLIYL